MESSETGRRMPRYVMRLPCQVVRERDFRLVADRIENLSATGLSVSPAEPVLTGEKLIVSFLLPHVGVWIDADAYVSRVIHGRRPGEDQRALGLAFVDINELQRAAIARELRSLAPSPPGRAQRCEASSRIARVLGWLSTRIEPTWENFVGVTALP